MLAIGHDEVEEELIKLQSKGVFTIIESDSDMDLLADALNYEECDLIIANSLLSKEKLIRLATAAREIGEGRTKLIALIQDFRDREFIAHMVGLGVCSFHLITNLSGLAADIEEYPKRFNYSLLAHADQVMETFKTEAPKGTVSIGVFSVSAGAGSTHYALSLGRRLAEQRKRVACVDLSGKGNFAKVESGNKYLDFFIADDEKPDEKTSLLQMLYSSLDYPYLILDFGDLFEIRSDLVLGGARREYMDDFMRCNYKVGFGFADVWHRHKLQFFKSQAIFQDEVAMGQMDFILSGPAGSVDAAAKDLKMDIWERGDEAYTEDLLKRIGVSAGRQAPVQSIRKGLFRK